MTLTTTASRVDYQGSGSTGPFSVPFRFDDEDDLLVVKRDAEGTETELAITTHYTVSGAGDATGSITLVTALASGETLSILRRPAVTQPSSFRNQGTFRGASHETAMDRITMLVQALQDQADRSFGVSRSYDPSPLTLRLRPETGKVLAWLSATQLGNSTLDSSSVALPGNGRTVATLSAYLANNAVFNVKDYGALGDGVTDDLAAFAACAAEVPATGGIIFVPHTTQFYRLSGDGATLVAPKIGCNITQNDVWVLGEGTPLIKMTDWDDADLAAAPSDSGAGANIFTAILFGNGVVGGGVVGLRFEGEHTAGTPPVNLQPRAKAIGIDGASNIYVRNCYGTRVMGNLVNARGGGSGLGTSYYVSVTDCFAEECAENGFNYMGGTEECVFSDNITINNEYQGFESGTYGLTCTGNICLGNKNGISHVGRRGTINGNVCRLNGFSGIHLQYNSATFNGSDNVISGNVCDENNGEDTGVGILADGLTARNKITGNKCRDNGAANQGGGLKLASGCIDYSIVDNDFFDTGVGAQVVGMNIIISTGVRILNNRTKGNSTWGLLVQSTSDDIFVDGNSFSEGLVSISALATNVSIGHNTGWLTGSATFNPSSLADGAGETTTVAVTGCLVGDYVQVSFSNPLQGVLLTAWASASGTVSARFQNESGGVVDLAEGTLRVRCYRR